MGIVVAVVVVFGFFGSVLAALTWLGSRARRRGVAGPIMGIAEQIWHPIAYEAHEEITVQAERKVPMPSPGDPPGPDSTPDSPEGPKR